MALTNKFSLGEKVFLSVSINGTQPEVRITSTGKRTCTLTLGEIKVLSVESSGILQKEVHLGTTVSPYGGWSVRRSCPDMSTAGLSIITEQMTDAQPQDPDDFRTIDFVLSKTSAVSHVRLLPKILECVHRIEEQLPAINLAYDVVRDQLQRLFETHGKASTPEEFMQIMRVLCQYVPTSFLVRDFKSRSAGTTLNIKELIETVLCQFDYIYHNIC